MRIRIRPGQGLSCAISIKRPDTTQSYYEHWVVALEKVLADLRAVDPEVLRERTHEVLTTPPDRHHQKAHLELVAIDAAKRP
ncbi:SH3-like domain-containing protein [Saccharopolyspora rhizosphaerae]|uniref:SH3-like domain-containing protein n=1 Tax=Saccharopolyspora rhizosphaerae TaxID=2492662 RepID=UPI0018F71664|nr:SH3-like domain-containing protein [Saccharopolyspora rhizosphaerae]